VWSAVAKAALRAASAAAAAAVDRFGRGSTSGANFFTLLRGSSGRASQDDEAVRLASPPFDSK